MKWIIALLFTPVVLAQSFSESDITRTIQQPAANDPQVLAVRTAFAVLVIHDRSLRREKSLREQIAKLEAGLRQSDEGIAEIRAASDAGVRWYPAGGLEEAKQAIQLQVTEIQKSLDTLAAATQPDETGEMAVYPWEMSARLDDVVHQIAEQEQQIAKLKQRAIDPSKPMDEADKAAFLSENQQAINRLMEDQRIQRESLAMLREALAKHRNVDLKLDEPSVALLRARFEELNRALGG